MFLSDAAKREQATVENELRLERRKIEMNLVSLEFSKGKSVNPFLDKRTNHFSTANSLNIHTFKSMATPWPTSTNLHVQLSCQDFGKPLSHIFSQRPEFQGNVSANQYIVPIDKDLIETFIINEVYSVEQVELMLQELFIDDTKEPLILRVFDSFKNMDEMGQISLQWVNLYEPQCQQEIMGFYNRKCASKLKKWLKKWIHNSNCTYKYREDSDFESSDENSKPFLCVQGPIGSFKTSMVHQCAREMGYSVLEVNTSQNRSSKDIFSIIGEAVKSDNSFFASSKLKPKEKVLILLDDVDILLADDKSMWVALNQVLRNSKCPVVMTFTGFESNLF